MEREGKVDSYHKLLYYQEQEQWCKTQHFRQIWFHLRRGKFPLPCFIFFFFFLFLRNPHPHSGFSSASESSWSILEAWQKSDLIRPLISDHIKGPLVTAFRSPLMKALDRSVETLGLWIVTSSVTFIKSANQCSFKLCLSDLIFATLMLPFLLAYLGFFCFFLFLLAFFRFMFYVVCARVWYLALRHNNLLIT